jgi:hypothetical protein
MQQAYQIRTKNSMLYNRGTYIRASPPPGITNEMNNPVLCPHQTSPKRGRLRKNEGFGFEPPLQGS